MNKYYKYIKDPIITEATNKQMELYNKYFFKVEKNINKIEIRKAIEYIFKVNVMSVNIINVLPKFKRKGKYSGYTSAYKKAIVKVVPGQRISDLSEIK
ncbi:50S ribosomal protein L23 ['Crotalaria aegyptiaca' phytoplasma]|uniref:Large ribosomal subunit protein uL23 n=1 Tax=Candidatus Phytoplasma crotalariae TaxID=2982627 RepID=A0ABT9D5N8_9MOLU|nr:50S ribosomal protein L23 ['Crotalaria aegyptiaca' phytoplasma]MDO8059164.1 50S ribosomal protein L23 ['Crotalaria aegyptiaca' phytoplasma]